MRDSAIASPHTITAITVKRVIASINLNGVTQFDGIVRCGKEQTMRLIDADELGASVIKNTVFDKGDVIKLIEDAPIIEIIRCRECKYADKCSRNVAMIDTYQMYEKIDFCSYGERSSE